ncbi:zinc ribbon domain-containing protein [uncultured Methanobrevibacter sp.]|uniref:zinc ribbon domain-containing protein n=1 Tax=uncultured Methanobrevibacter sp. TaxID=253161 RepID=UPI00262B7828|nr:zinc ribbon domain-containing protein [uncultured Methanobrevibacter sp.]
MTIDDNHTHFCIYCGSRIEPGQNFCADCGKPVYRQEPRIEKKPSEYDAKIDELEREYKDKQSKAKQLVEKQFDPNHLAYERFNSSITKSNNLFDIQVGIARKMAEMDTADNPFVVKEMENKLQTLQTFIDKMEDLTSELVIHLSSNKKDTEDINNLFNDMDELIDSVKDY